MTEQVNLFGPPDAIEERRARVKKRLASVVLSAPLDAPMIRVLSLGLGLQSVTLAFMSARGDLPMLDAAIFSDTGEEKRATYEYLDYMRPLLPFPIHVVRRPGMTLGQHAVKIAHEDVTRTSSPPWFTANPDGMLPKQCNSEFKKRPVQREIKRMIRERTGAHRLPKEPVVEQWFGMTMDELNRLSDSGVAYLHHRYPLVEEPFRFKRAQCETWLAERQLRIPPKSSCFYCPYQRNDQWRDMRDNHPLDWADAVAFDRAIRPGFFGMEGEAYVHKQRVPLDEVDLSTLEDHGQGSVFGCGDGVCGT